ncbi:MAG TPA: lytic murein transglycosylase [Candidatus Paceibacterota bacterium]|nr:lytic murein transglycosylase [Candidatus Paceibacterota bacterium]
MRKTAIFLSLGLFLSLLGALMLLRRQADAQTQPDVCNNPSSDEIAQACQDYAVESKKLQQLQAQLNTQKQKTGALQQNVSGLIAQINATQSKIKGQITNINNLTVEINQKQKAIGDLSTELDRQHDSMQQLIKRTDEIDQKGAAYVLLSAQSVTEFYQDLDDFTSVKQSLYSALNKVKQIKSATETQKQQLQDKQSQALDAKNALENQKKQIQVSQTQAQQLLDTSKTEEQRQAALVAQQQQKVAAIESKLFSFAGGATKAIPFKDAYTYAKGASAATGVRPAFILAILTQESNLGANVGTCNRAGDPPSKSWVNVMSPTRDQPAFTRITAALGLNPDTTPVSCPLPGGGWGGAMGPAQFIPSTWEIIAPRVAAALGKSAANPWAARDAIMASAIYLKDRGGVGSETNERNAACKYYSGRSCDGKRPPNSFYGNSVMALTRTIQADIDYLEKYGVAKQ